MVDTPHLFLFFCSSWLRLTCSVGKAPIALRPHWKRRQKPLWMEHRAAGEGRFKIERCSPAVSRAAGKEAPKPAEEVTPASSQSGNSGSRMERKSSSMESPLDWAILVVFPLYFRCCALSLKNLGVF